MQKTKYNFDFKRIWISGCIFISLVLMGAQCNSATTSTPIIQANSTPEIVSFTLSSSDPVLPDGRVNIQVNVRRNGSKIDSFRWFADEGSFIGGQDTPIITYQAPDRPGLYEIQVDIRYNDDLSTVKRSTVVEVELPPTPTYTPTLTPTPTNTFTPTPTSTPTSTPTTTATQTFTPLAEALVVAPNGLNLRSGPGTEYSIIGSLQKDDTLDVLGRTDSNEWLQVIGDNPGIEGWISASPQFVEINVDFETIPIVEALPLPSPTSPLADAVVIAPTGVELRSGPGLGYDVITILPNDTTLNNLRPVVGKSDWIKVVLNPGTTEAVEGYVNIASGLIRINVDLADIVPIHEYGPHLVSPEPYAERAVDHFITFRWNNVGLQKGQCYSLILYPAGEDKGPDDACFHFQYVETLADVTPSEHGCTAGEYYWSVGIATPIQNEDDGNLGMCEASIGSDGKPLWRDDSERDERNVIGIGVPPRDRPPSSGGGGDSGSLPTSPK